MCDFLFRQSLNVNLVMGASLYLRLLPNLSFEIQIRLAAFRRPTWVCLLVFLSKCPFDKFDSSIISLASFN